MSDLMEIIRERRSVRKFEEKEVSEEMINTLLDSVRWAPSWANTQCWEIIVIRDKAIKGNIQNTMIGKNPAAKAIEAAPVLLAICGKLKSSGYYKNEAPTKFGDWILFDLGIAAQNICLAAHHLGLGTVVVGMFDHNKVKEILNIPEDHEVAALIPVGYPSQIPSAPKRREINEFTHYNTF